MTSFSSIPSGVLAGRYPHCYDLRFQPLGKPHRGPFEAACLRSGTRNMVMIGDQLETDIQGARTSGIDAVWVRPGEFRDILPAVPSLATNLFTQGILNQRPGEGHRSQNNTEFIDEWLI